MTQGIGFMELSWSHPVLDDQSGYKVYRSSDGVNYNCVATVDILQKIATKTIASLQDMFIIIK